MSVTHPAGMLIYTEDGHVSVQLMYPASERPISNEYVFNGYEASFGTYDANEAKHMVTHHVLGAPTLAICSSERTSRVCTSSTLKGT